MLPRLLCAIVIGDVVRASVDGASLDHTATRLEVGADMAARKLISSVSSRTRGGSVPLGVAHDIIRQHAFTVPECVRAVRTTLPLYVRALIGQDTFQVGAVRRVSAQVCQGMVVASWRGTRRQYSGAAGW